MSEGSWATKKVPGTASLSHLEDQGCVGRNLCRMARHAVCQRRWDDQDTCAALLQTNQTFLKSFDYLPLANRYCDRLSLIIPRTIKFFARLLQPACLLSSSIAARLGCASAA